MEQPSTPAIPPKDSSESSSDISSELKRYHVYGSVVGNKYLGTVEAKSPEDAKTLGWEMDSLAICLCHSCSHHCEDPEVTVLAVEIA